MSNVNIRRAVENIRANTTVYTPVVEMVVNGIQAIDELRPTNGRVSIRVLRHAQARLDARLSAVVGFEIEDNGVGFTDGHRASFDTLYTDRRISEGGKGFGRFTCLKYFEDLYVKSVYDDGTGFGSRRFRMGKGQDIIVDEELGVSEKDASGTIVSLTGLKKNQAFESKLVTIAKSLVERLLPYFIAEGYACPRVLLSESDGSDKDILSTADLSGMAYKPTKEEIEAHLQREKFSRECATKKDVGNILSETSLEAMKDDVVEIVKKISGTSKNDLIHYIAQRRAILA